MKTRFASVVMSAIALAAASPGARSQSTVNIYGIIDSSLTTTTMHDPVERKRVNRLDSGTGYGSRLGFRVIEDLGDGLKANVLLEEGIAVDTGMLQQGGAAFGRQAFVGLSNTHWSLSAGRQYSPINSLIAASEAFGQTYWGNSQGTGIGQHSARATASDGGFQAAARINNSVLLSGSYGPWTARLMAAFGDEKQASGRSIGTSLAYQSGSWLANIAYHKENQFATDIPTGAKPDSQAAWAVGGTYDFAIAKLFAGYYRFAPSSKNMVLTSASTLRTTSAWVGVRVPVFATDTIIAQVMNSRYRHIDGVAQGRALTMGVTYEHALSKRTALYTSWGRVNNNGTSSNWLWGSTSTVVPTRAGASLSALSIGMWHKF